MRKMENIKRALAMLLLFGEGFCLPAANTTAELVQTAENLNLKTEAFVVSGWIKVHNKQSIKLLERLLASELKAGNNLLYINGEEWKIVITEDKKPGISLQLVTASEHNAEMCRSFWQSFADNWGNREIIGITLLAQAYEEMSGVEQQRLLMQAQSFLHAQGQTHQSQNGMEGVYYTPKLKRSLMVAQEAFNFNLVIRNREKSCDVYLASPIIYQTY